MKYIKILICLCICGTLFSFEKDTLNNIAVQDVVKEDSIKKRNINPKNTEVQNKKKDDFPWETIVGIIGALAWIPWLFEKFTPSKIYGSIISQVFNQGQFNSRVGILYFYKLSITCINKNFNIKSVAISVKYPGDNQWHLGHVFWAHTSSWIINNGQPQKKLKLPNDSFLGFVNVLERDRPSYYYLTFIVENVPLQDFEFVKIEFTNYNKVVKEVLLPRNEIDENKILFDDSLWS